MNFGRDKTKRNTTQDNGNCLYRSGLFLSNIFNAPSRRADLIKKAILLILVISTVCLVIIGVT